MNILAVIVSLVIFSVYSSNVLPCRPPRDSRDMRLPQSKAVADPGKIHALTCQTSDLTDVTLGDFRHSVATSLRRQPKFRGVRLIRAGRAVFEISQSIVALDPRDVVDLHVRSGANECNHHKSMNELAATNAIQEKFDGQIPSGTNAGPKNEPAPARWGIPDLLHATKRRHDVQTIVSSDRAPFLCGKFFVGKISGSHGEPPVKVPEVRPGPGVTSSHTGRFYFSRNGVIAGRMDDAATALVVIGTHLDGGARSSLYAVRIGDTTRAEKLSAAWMPYFGSNAVNGEIYTPMANSTWRKTTFRRPAGVDQMLAFYEDRDQFTNSAYVPEPLILSGLGPLIKDIDYIVVYFDGGTKVYLKANTSARDAEAIDSAIRRRNP